MKKIEEEQKRLAILDNTKKTEKEVSTYTVPYIKLER